MSNLEDPYYGFPDFITVYDCDWFSDSEPRASLSREIDEREFGLWRSLYDSDASEQEEERHEKRSFVYGSSINLIDFLKSRDTNERVSKTRTRSTLLSFCLSRWPALPRIEMLLEAKQLLSRRIWRWEGAILTFIQNFALKASREQMSPSDASLLKPCDIEAFAPITIIDIVGVFLKIGANPNAKNDEGDDLLVYLSKQYGFDEVRLNILEFIEFFLRNGYDIKQNSENLVMALCDSKNKSSFSITSAKLKMFNTLFDGGLILSDSAKRDLLPLFTKHLIATANETAVEVLHLLLKHGCSASKALAEFDSCVQSRWEHERNNDLLECILKIVYILLENGAEVNYLPPPNASCWSDDDGGFLFRILDELCMYPSISNTSMLQLVKDCVARGFDVKLTNHEQKNLLMAFCAYYSNDDLPEVVRFLCSSGIDVNAVNKHDSNALLYLASNGRASLKLKYEIVVCLLTELKMDVKIPNCSGLPHAMNDFVSALARRSQCMCYYGTLKRMNESDYGWKIIDLLLESGVERINEKRGARHTTNMILEKLWKMQDLDRVCDNCLNEGRITESEAIAALGTVLFDKLFNLIQHLLRSVELEKTAPSVPDTVWRDPLLIIFRFLKGEQLIRLVKLFCENGANVNAKVLHEGSVVLSLDAIGVLKYFNEDQSHLIDRLTEIMEPYGYINRDCLQSAIYP